MPEIPLTAPPLAVEPECIVPQRDASSRTKGTDMHDMSYSIDIDTEELMPLSQCAHTMPGGAVNPATVWRWSLRGLHGVRLPTVLLGGTRHTSREARAWWVATITAIADGREAGRRTPSQRHREIAAAERELAMRPKERKKRLPPT
jgi:hypothetical protein